MAGGLSFCSPIFDPLTIQLAIQRDGGGRTQDVGGSLRRHRPDSLKKFCAFGGVGTVAKLRGRNTLEEVHDGLKRPAADTGVRRHTFRQRGVFRNGASGGARFLTDSVSWRKYAAAVVRPESPPAALRDRVGYLAGIQSHRLSD